MAEAGRVVGGVGDEGIDGIISEDKLGLDNIYIQAKRWDGSVGRPELQKFVGALHGKRARKGVFITTGTFTADARDYVSQIDPRVVLIDGRQLAAYMVEYGLGVTTRTAYELLNPRFAGAGVPLRNKGLDVLFLRSSSELTQIILLKSSRRRSGNSKRSPEYVTLLPGYK